MDFLKQNKVTVVGVVALAACALIYFMYFSGDGSSATLSTTSEASTVTQNLLVQLQNLNTIKLDQSIFNNPVFLSLTDYGVQIPAEPIGRDNPFAPIAK